MTLPTARWLSRVERGDGPIYLAILKALEAAIAEGDLQAGEQLPPQRTVADRLSVDFTTVTRAYAAARARGLVEGAVGRGTFVRGRAGEAEAGLVDLSMNLPPPPLGVSLGRLLKETSRTVLDRTDPAALMAYHPGAGSLAQRTAGAAWLAPTVGEVSPDRILVSPGAQTALAALFTTLMRRGDALVVEPLTYPGALALAAHLGLRAIPCPADGEGVSPDALERLCAEQKPKAIYLIPTLQNPVATTMSLARRREVVRIAMAAGVPIIEDDAYGRLPPDPPPAMAALAPGSVWHVATLSKALSPGLRTAFVLAPDAGGAQRLALALRAMSLMASPLTTAMATAWIREGVAQQVLAGVRAETQARQVIAHSILPAAVGGPEGVHVWLDLPEGRDPAALREEAARRGLSLVTAEAFAVTPGGCNGLRISLGGQGRRETLVQGLRGVAALLDADPARTVAAGRV